MVNEIEKETDQNKQDYLHIALEFNKDDLTTAKENLEKKVNCILDAATDLLPDGVKIDDNVKIDYIFIDDDRFFDDHDLKTDDREYLEDLLQKTDFAEVRIIIPNDIEPVREKSASPDLRYEDVIFPASDVGPSDVELSDAETMKFVNSNADSLSDIETTDNKPDVEFLQQRSSHLSDRLRCMQKQKQNKVKFFKKVPQRRRNRIKRKTRN